MQFANGIWEEIDMAENRKVRWGIIGPGGIAKAFLGGVMDSELAELVAIGTRNPDRPGLAEGFPGARIVEGYQALIDDPEVEAIYIATPHPGHAEWAIKCAQGGKHVLCEKPMGLTASEATMMFNAAKAAGTFMGEAFMYRLHPQTLKLIELVKSGATCRAPACCQSYRPSSCPARQILACRPRLPCSPHQLQKHRDDGFR